MPPLTLTRVIGMYATRREDNGRTPRRTSAALGGGPTAPDDGVVAHKGCALCLTCVGPCLSRCPYAVLFDVALLALIMSLHGPALLMCRVSFSSLVCRSPHIAPSISVGSWGQGRESYKCTDASLGRAARKSCAVVFHLSTSCGLTRSLAAYRLRWCRDRWRPLLVGWRVMCYSTLLMSAGCIFARYCKLSSHSTVGEGQGEG